MTPKEIEGAGSFEEKRAHRRKRLQTDITLTSETNFYAGFIQDISTGGLFISTPNPLPERYTCEIEFSLPDNGEAIKANCEVSWSRKEITPDGEPAGMGLRFLDLSNDDLERIDTFVENREPLFHVD